MFQHLGKAAEIRLDRAQQLPDLGGTLLDGQRAEAHLQTVQQGQQGAGAGHQDPLLPLQRFHRVRAAHDLGVKPLQRQEHHGKIRGMGRNDIFADALALGADGVEQGAAGGLAGGCVARFGGFRQPGVVLLRKLAVNGQINGLVFFSRQDDGKFHPLLRAGNHRHVPGVLRRSKRLFQQRAQLHFAPDAPGFHIAQHPFQVAYAAGQRMHFAQRTVHLLQSLADLRKAVVQALFQRAVQLFIHGLTHFFQLTAVFAGNAL